MSLINSIFTFFRFNKKNWKAVALCLVAATVFWFFNALNKNYAANISFPLVFNYDQQKYIPVNPLPENVRINVSGLGWDLFRKSIGLKVPALVIPLDKPTEVKKIVGTNLPAIFSSQLEGLQINFVLTDTLFVRLDYRAKRKVWLRLANVDRYIHEQYGRISKPVITPDTVMISGPRSILMTLPDTIDLPLSEQKIDENFSEEVEVIIPHGKLLSQNPSIVTVSFNVDKLMEVREMLSVQVVNAPSRSKPTLAEKTTSIIYRVPVSMMNSLPDNSLSAVVDLKNLSKGTHRIAPRIVGLPKYTHIVKVDSVQITF